MGWPVLLLIPLFKLGLGPGSRKGDITLFTTLSSACPGHAACTPGQEKGTSLFSLPSPRPASVTQRVLQAQPLCRSDRPIIIPKRPITHNAPAQPLQIILPHPTLHNRPPIARPIHRPGRHRQPRHLLPTLGKARPSPVPADSTIPARSGFASTYRHTVKKCRSSCTGKLLNRPWYKWPPPAE